MKTFGFMVKNGRGGRREARARSPGAAAPAPAPAERPAIGALVAGRYRIEGVLGYGRTSTVFAAVDRTRGMAVALKLMHAHLVGVGVARDRFRRNAEALRCLRSEHIALLHDVGKHAGGAPYLVMERVYGHDLRRELARRGPLSWADALLVTERVCLALEVMHAAGFAYALLAPEDVLIERDPDLGAIRRVVMCPSVSRLRFVGPPTCAAARAALAASASQVAPAADRSSERVVFSVACLLFFLLMGRWPFCPTVCARAARGALTKTLALASVHRLRRDVPTYVDDVLRIALFAEPACRFGTIGALRIALGSDLPLLSRADHGERALAERTRPIALSVLLVAIVALALTLALRC